MHHFGNRLENINSKKEYIHVYINICMYIHSSYERTSPTTCMCRNCEKEKSHFFRRSHCPQIACHNQTHHNNLTRFDPYLIIYVQLYTHVNRTRSPFEFLAFFCTAIGKICKLCTRNFLKTYSVFFCYFCAHFVNAMMTNRSAARQLP